MARRSAAGITAGPCNAGIVARAGRGSLRALGRLTVRSAGSGSAESKRCLKNPLETKNPASEANGDKIKSRHARVLDGWMTQAGDTGIVTELAAKSRPGAGRNAAR